MSSFRARRGWREQDLQGHRRSPRKGGWKIVGLTRLSSVFPFNTLNYAAGLTGVSLKKINMVASWNGIMPGTILYVYVVP